MAGGGEGEGTGHGLVIPEEALPSEEMLERQLEAITISESEILCMFLLPHVFGSYLHFERPFCFAVCFDWIRNLVACATVLLSHKWFFGPFYLDLI